MSAPHLRACSMMAMASAAPSAGSVPAPSSSNSSSDRSSHSLSMRTVFVMCAENVDSDCSMLCSSPMSAMISWNTGMVLPSAHGMCRPHCVMAASRPMVLSVTVLPPVFGPVMTSVSNSPPSETSIGTAVSFGRSGWRARRSCSSLSASSGAIASSW